jgi:hypothetical protein
MTRPLLLLLLSACATSEPVSMFAAQDLGPPAGATPLAVSAAMPGALLTLTVTGLPSGQRVTFLRGTPGQGICLPQLGGTCLDVANHVILGRADADSQGIATFQTNLPVTLPTGLTGAFQAGWVDAGVLQLAPVVIRTTGLDDPDLLITELAVQPTDGEFVEIHNPGTTTADLSNVWIADYNTAIQLTVAGGIPSTSDFRARFPDGATLAPGAYVTVALEPASDFIATYGVAPDYDFDATDLGAPAMSGDFGGSSGLTNGDEMLHLFRWDGASDGVVDLDYLVYGNTSDAMDRTGVVVGTHAYAADTAVGAQSPGTTHGFGEVLTRCDTLEVGQVNTGGNGLGGTDETSEDFAQSWRVRPLATPGEATNCDLQPLTFAEVTDFVLPPGFHAPAAQELIEDASSFTAIFGVAPPASIDFTLQAVFYASQGSRPFPGSFIDITSVNALLGELLIDINGQVPGTTCEILDYAPAAWTMIAIDLPSTALGTLTLTSNIDAADCTDGVPNGSDCAHDDLCETGAVCHWLTVSESGFCRGTDEQGKFFGSGGAIPDADAAGWSETLNVTGLSSVPEDAIISLDISHADPSELTIVLSNPLGTPTTIWDREVASGPLLELVRTPFTPGDEDVNGSWTLTVIDHVTGNSGDIEGWSLELTSRYD